MCNSFLTSVIQLIECFAILSSIVLQSSITGHALVIQLNSNTSQHIFNSLGNFVTLTVHSMSAVLGTESALLGGVMDIW